MPCLALEDYWPTRPDVLCVDQSLILSFIFIYLFMSLSILILPLGLNVVGLLTFFLDIASMRFPIPPQSEPSAMSFIEAAFRLGG